MTFRIRPYRSEDLDSLYAISLATGAAGGDAAALYEDGRLVGHIYAAPYAALSPGLILVVEDAAGVAGFVLGAPDTRAFEDRLEREWWPALRQRYAAPSGAAWAWTPDERRRHRIHVPRRTPAQVVAAFPAHMHLNLLPRAQGQGLGRTLLAAWCDSLRPAGLHVGVNPDNGGALAFWGRCGFQRLAPAEGVVWLGRAP